MRHDLTPTLPSLQTHSHPNTTCRSSTRSIDTPSHSFFIELSDRTGKATKHFRRTYPSTSTICECSLFPAFSDQRQSSIPIRTLPESFRRLCLFCLHLLAVRYGQAYMNHNCSDVYCGAMLPMFCDDAWASKLEAHYEDYYAERQMGAIAEEFGRAGAEAESERACEWIRSRMQSEMKAAGRSLQRAGKSVIGRQRAGGGVVDCLQAGFSPDRMTHVCPLLGCSSPFAPYNCNGGGTTAGSVTPLNCFTLPAALLAVACWYISGPYKAEAIEPLSVTSLNPCLSRWL